MCDEEDENDVDDDENKKSGISKGLRRMRFKSFADDVSAEAMNRRAIMVNLMILMQYAELRSMTTGTGGLVWTLSLSVQAKAKERMRSSGFVVLPVFIRCFVSAIIQFHRGSANSNSMIQNT